MEEVSFERQTIEIERLVGEADAQALVRAEATVSGASREPAEPLLEEAVLSIGTVEVQTDRVVLDGTIYCQAIYRQGDESMVRALTAQGQFSQVIDLPGAGPRMICRVQGSVEQVEAGYDNGRMIFQVGIALRAQVSKLEGTDVITDVKNLNGLETQYEEICSVKLSAEASGAATLHEEVSLPPQLDARLALLDWYTVKIDQVTPDLGGVRVQGEVQAETLIGTGVAMRPVALVKVSMPFNELVELPEWLSGNVRAEAEVTRLTSQINQGESDEESTLRLEAALLIRLRALGKDCATALTDAYATGNTQIEAQREPVQIATGIQDIACSQSFRGTLLLPEGAPGVGTVLAVRARPLLSQWIPQDGKTTLEGVLDVGVLYLPGGSEKLYATRAELPFSIQCEGEYPSDAWISIQAIGAEASALMSDRLEFKCTLRVEGSAREEHTYTLATDLTAAEATPSKGGLRIIWPQEGDSAWSIGKRYAIPQANVQAELGENQAFNAKSIVLRI